MPQHALAIVLGTVLALFGNQLADPFWSALMPLLLLLLIYCPAYRFVLLLAVAFLWSNAVLHYHLEHRLSASHDNRVTLLRAVIADIPRVETGRTRLVLESLEIPKYPGTMPRRARLVWYQDQTIPLPGEQWQFEVKLKQPRGLLNPGGFDYEAWQFFHGIDATGYVRKSRANKKLAAAPWNSIESWRMVVASKIDQACSDCEQRGLIKALALGYRGDIPASQSHLLQSSGTAHLLAISGLHIGMVAMLFYACGRYAWKYALYRSNLTQQQCAGLAALVAACAYAALAGFSLPTLRALLMLSLLLIALQTRNRINLLQSLSLALVLIVACDPRVPGTASFWLSFGALLVICFARFRSPPGLRWWQQLLLLQCCFALLLVPLVSLIFTQFSPAGLPANLVAIPLVSCVVLPAVLTGCVLSIFSIEWAQPIFALADALLKLLLQFLDLLLNSGLSAIGNASPPLLLLALLVTIVLLLTPLPRPIRGLAVLVFMVSLCWQPARPKPGEYEITVLDVGMGTSMLLRTRNHSLIYDLGPGRPGAYNAVDWALRPLMLRHGVTQPDLLILSHVDQDHSGGLHSFRQDYDASRMVSGTPAEIRARFSLPHPVRSCHHYPDWHWDGVSFRFLNPGVLRADASSNNRSCILFVDGFQRSLIPGDIESVTESMLLSVYGDSLSAELLLAPHHGSETSSSMPFLAAVKPQQVIFTLARNNRWGFPKNTVLARYDKLGARQYRSDRDAAISVLSNSAGLVVEGSRLPLRRIWRRW